MELMLLLDNPDSIVEANNLIHDCYFELKDIKFDRNQNALGIYFRRLAEEEKRLVNQKLLLKKYKIPEYMYHLRIDNVMNWSIFNLEKAEVWDYFNILKFCKDKNLIRLPCVLAIELRIETSKFQVSIFKTDKIINEKTKYSLT